MSVSEYVGKTAAERCAALQATLDSLIARKKTPKSKWLKTPAKQIWIPEHKPEIIFFLRTRGNTFEQGRSIEYSGRCPSCKKRQIRVATTFKDRDAIWPPAAGIPRRCAICESKRQEKLKATEMESRQ